MLAKDGVIWQFAVIAIKSSTEKQIKILAGKNTNITVIALSGVASPQRRHTTATLTQLAFTSPRLVILTSNP